MTALKPIENRRVIGVASERYPLNGLCAHPECGEAATDPHHIFPRSQIGNDSWFVAFDVPPGIIYNPMPEGTTIPHVTGLCRGHHDAVENHDAWIRLEEDGVFVWYDQRELGRIERLPEGDREATEWAALAALDPQPCSGEKRKKPVKRFTGEARRTRRTISIKVPDDWEDGGLVYDETLLEVKERLVQMELFAEDQKIPAFEAIIGGLRDWLNTPLHHIGG